MSAPNAQKQRIRPTGTSGKSCPCYLMSLAAGSNEMLVCGAKKAPTGATAGGIKRDAFAG